MQRGCQQFNSTGMSYRKAVKIDASVQVGLPLLRLSDMFAGRSATSTQILVDCGKRTVTTRSGPLQIVLTRACLYGRGACADFTLNSAALVKSNPTEWQRVTAFPFTCDLSFSA